MKTNTKYVQKLKKLFGLLKKSAGKSKKPVYHNPVEALIFAVLCENSTESAAKAAFKKIQSHFVDFNDLRVARPEETAEILGADIKEPEKCAAKLNLLLNAVFQKYDCLKFEDFISGGKKGLREALGKLNGMSAFISNYCLMTVVNAHTIPLTEKMIQYLKTYKIVEPTLDNEHIAAFIERHISASNGYNFYALVRHDSELVNPKASQLSTDKKAK